ncbi:MAG: TetR/AcrR family transcriptional regulator [Alphaproteobacteria bacterium]|nr:TetR/AcrR family transcriptional regulator [Alphaproteobacteria bacterium]
MGIAERREREREARRSAVLEAARALLLEKGFSGTTTKLIAERCELSEATLFFYFESKDEILVSLLFEGIDFWARGLERLIKLEVSPEQKLARLWRYFVEVREQHPEYFHLSTYLAQPCALVNVTAEVRDEIVRRSGANFARLDRLMRDVTGAANGRPAADLVWAAFLGLMTTRDARRNLGADPHPNDRELGLALKTLIGGLLPGAGEGASS